MCCTLMAWARSFSALASFLSFASLCCMALLSARDAEAPWISANVASRFSSLLRSAVTTVCSHQACFSACHSRCCSFRNSRRSSQRASLSIIRFSISSRLAFSSSSNCILLSSFCLKDSKTLLGCPSTCVTVFASRPATCRIFSIKADSCLANSSSRSMRFLKTFFMRTSDSSWSTFTRSSRCAKTFPLFWWIVCNNFSSSFHRSFSRASSFS
mmetsp:Transcript_58260/g.103956  ORF Transcript_58260/g.103956 Transcript_58260/m.103956 type:complete len:213 (-) Transcript_58260:771-1409(-)